MECGKPYNENYTKFEFYKQNFDTINEIKFTYREVDILSCLFNELNDREISELLSISLETLKVHTRNIRAKTSSSSNKILLKYIKRLKKSYLFKTYYKHILFDNLLKKKIFDIGQKLNPNLISIKLNNCAISKIEKDMLLVLNEHLKLANLVLNESSESSSSVSILNNKLKKNNRNIIIIKLDNNEKELSIRNQIIIDLTKNYYESVFFLIEQILKKSEVTNYYNEYLKESKLIDLNNLEYKKSRSYILYFLITAFIMLYGALLYQSMRPVFFKKDVIKSNVFLSNFDTKIYRKKMMEIINSKLSNKSNIQKIALVGIGGAGKTTLARQYSKNSDATLIWEVNSTTKEGVFSSFQQLSYRLAANEEEYAELKTILSLQNFSAKYGKFMTYLTEKFKQNSNWLLIYDNLENFRHIQDFFPYDLNVWGNGKIIITTRDSNIINNIFLSDDSVIPVLELTSEEKYTLFSNILNKPDYSNEIESESTKNFLQHIPPFPLDVSIAAHYLKETNLSYDNYVNLFNKRDKKFILEQEKLLNEIGSYLNSRYSIISACVRQLIKNNSDFEELLFFISLIDSQNISRELLLNFKPSIVVDRFLYFMKKFSLITEHKLSKYKSNINSVSIHRSSQQNIFSCLDHLLEPDKKKIYIKKINNVMAKYMSEVINQYDIDKVRLIISHAESFIDSIKDISLVNIKMGNVLSECYRLVGEYNKPEKLLQKIIKANEFFSKKPKDLAEINSYLGVLYRAQGKFGKSLKYLKQSSKLFIEEYGINNDMTQKSIINLSYTYRDIGEYDKSKELLLDLLNKLNNNVKAKQYIEIKADLANIYRLTGKYTESLKIFKDIELNLNTHYKDNSLRIAKHYIRVGSLYGYMGKYKQGLKLLDLGHKIFTNYYDAYNVKMSWSLIQSGNFLKEIHEHKKSLDSLERAYEIYKNHYDAKHIRVGWSAVYLGAGYLESGEYKKALSLLEESAQIHIIHYGSEHIDTAWVLENLAKVYIKTGNLHEAKFLIDKVAKIYKKSFGKMHVKYGKILLIKGYYYFADNNLDLAEITYKSALKIYNENSHAKSYYCYESLGDLYAFQARNLKGKKKISEILNKKSKDYYTKAINIVIDNFPENSNYLERLRSKI